MHLTRLTPLVQVFCLEGANKSDTKTSSAGAEISDGPHREGLRTGGPNEFMFVYTLMQRESIYVKYLLFIILLLGSSLINLF